MKLSKTRIFLVLAFIIFTGILSGQTPQGFNYQAIARDEALNPIANENLQVKLAIMGDSSGSIIYWEELFETVNTNEFGLFTIVAGRGARLVSSFCKTFSEINWALTPMFFRIKVLYKEKWLEMGVSRLWSVPYALNSNGVSGILPYLGVTGKTANSDSALFSVRNRDGQLIFAVYNDGVRMYVNSGVKASTKGGFAIGGFGTGKGTQDYFQVYPDSTRVYSRNLGKSTKGGFAIGSFGTGKGSGGNYMDMTPYNYFIGQEAGMKATGIYNSVFGYKAGRNLTTGYNNTVIGHLADSALTTGFKNIVIGETAGFNMTSGDNNTLIGNGAGYSQTNQQYNVLVGTAAGYHINSTGAGGSYNTFMGINSGFAIQQSRDNTFLGTNSGYWLENGRGNTFIGIDAGRAGNDRTWAPG